MFLLLAMLTPLPRVLAQQGGQGGGGTAGSGASVGSRGETSRQQAGRSQADPRDNLDQSSYISGMVVLEDGSPPPVGAYIEVDCGRGFRREAAADTSGYFMFQAGSTGRASGLLPDASDGSAGDSDSFESWIGRQPGLRTSAGSAPSASLLGCELRVQLQGYQSNGVMLEAAGMFRNLDVGTIVLHPITRAQSTVVSVTALQAPKAAKKAMERTQKALREKNSVEAEKNLKSALGAYPKYAEAWFLLGQIYEQQQRNQEARVAYGKAIEADRRYERPYIRLAQLAGLEKKWHEVTDFTNRALELNPLGSPEGYFLNALACYHLDNLDEAEKSAVMARRLDVQHRIPQVYLVMANILSRKHDIAGSTEELRNYLKFVSTGPDAEKALSILQEREKRSKAPSGGQPEPHER